MLPFFSLALLKAPLFVGSEEIDLAMLKEAHEILFTIDEHYFPNGNEWIAGENISAADFAYISTLSTIVVRNCKVYLKKSHIHFFFFLFF